MILQQQLAKRHPPLLPAAQYGRPRVTGGDPQRVHRPLDGPVQFPQILRLDLVPYPLHIFHRLRHLLVGYVRIRHALAQLVVPVEDGTGGRYGGVDALPHRLVLQDRFLA